MDREEAWKDRGQNLHESFFPLATSLVYLSRDFSATACVDARAEVGAGCLMMTSSRFPEQDSSEDPSRKSSTFVIIC